MRVLKTFQPAALGARRFAARFGKWLVCVRYRHDPATGARVTTVELIVENTRVYCPRSSAGSATAAVALEPLGVKIGRGEILLRQQIKAAGGIWRYPEMVWEVTPEIVKKLRLPAGAEAGSGEREQPSAGRAGCLPVDAYRCQIVSTLGNPRVSVPIFSHVHLTLEGSCHVCASAKPPDAIHFCRPSALRGGRTGCLCGGALLDPAGAAPG